MTRGRRARSRHDLRQFDDLVHALDAILHRDLKDWMLYPQSCRTGDRASNPSGRDVGWRREREQDHRIAVSHDDFLRDVLASSPDICPGQISWDYDRAEII